MIRLAAIFTTFVSIGVGVFALWQGSPGYAMADGVCALLNLRIWWKP